MKILILEDNPIRIEKFKQLFRNQDLYIAENIQYAKEYCNFNEFPVMFLDHDLGNQIWVDSNEENTGYQFIKWLIENNFQKNALCYIHSMNPVGANKMMNLLLDNDRDAIWIPAYLILGEK
jgi:DNA-binding LacI/PurR family transcriptional regulator